MATLILKRRDTSRILLLPTPDHADRRPTGSPRAAGAGAAKRSVDVLLLCRLHHRAQRHGPPGRGRARGRRVRPTVPGPVDARLHAGLQRRHELALLTGLRRQELPLGGRVHAAHVSAGHGGLRTDGAALVEPGHVAADRGGRRHVASLAGQYGRLSLLWLWPRSMFQVLASFYQAQNIVLPTAAFDVLMVLFNGYFAVGLTYGRFGLPELGFVGCPLGTAVAVALRLVSYVAYMNWYRKYHRRCSWRWDSSFLDKEIVWNLVSVGMPLAAGELLENAQLTVLTLFAAKIGEIQLGTHNAMMELFYFATSPLYAVINASVTRIGNHLGAGEPSRAILAAQICGICIATLTALNSVVIVSSRKLLGRIFSDSPEVIDTFSQVCSLAALAYFILSFFCYALAVLQAQARPMPLAVGMVAGAWLVGIPSAYFFGVHTSHPSLLGLWEGMVCGYTVTSIASFIPAFGRPNWQEEAEKAVERSQLKEKELASPHESDRLLA